MCLDVSNILDVWDGLGRFVSGTACKNGRWRLNKHARVTVSSKQKFIDVIAKQNHICNTVTLIWCTDLGVCSIVEQHSQQGVAAPCMSLPPAFLLLSHLDRDLRIEEDR